ncbi:MAG: S8 family serine peptidase [Pseudomonadota bacterium]|nr:S8 family serine peptidase [Pseudomonadota bacterium]
MPMRLAFLLLLCLASHGAIAQKQRIEKAADMPRFSYKVDSSLDALVNDPAAFQGFAQAVRRDNESVLAKYDVADRAAQRQILGVLAQLDFLEGRYEEAGRGAAEIRALEDKPADKLVSGLQLRAMVAAQGKARDTTSEAYRREVGRFIADELRSMPYPVIENDIKGSKSGAELMGEALIMGNVRDRLQPVVTKAGGVLSSDLAPAVVSARYALVARLPLKGVLVTTFSDYLAANKVEKADIWKARDVELPSGRDYAQVGIAVWDSGVDAALFPNAVMTDASGKPALIAFDRYANPSREPLVPLSAELQKKLPQMRARTKGLSDLRSNIDSPEASAVKQLLSGLKREEYRDVIEELSLAGNHSHGTHVAGIAMAGNPYARLAISRIEFNHKLLPDPCPTDELFEKAVRNMHAYVEFFRKTGVRVVNMSWGGSVRGYETSLELCGIGPKPEDRKAIARKYFDGQKNALTAAMAGAPGILFVTSAGNSNQDSSFAEAIPAGIVLPNLITVGAVDKAGDEAPFTSYGPTVKVHANGYQVESYLPGGDRVALSGTSMSSPQVANLAAKMLALNPRLKPEDLIRIIVETSEKSADGRRVLVHPARAVSAARPG